MEVIRKFIDANSLMSVMALPGGGDPTYGYDFIRTA